MLQLLLTSLRLQGNSLKLHSSHLNNEEAIIWQKQNRRRRRRRSDGKSSANSDSNDSAAVKIIEPWQRKHRHAAEARCSANRARGSGYG